ncbi:hypothetical protein N7462_003411 [Penicillium macrosclerotiorum]|uniref:uncharacterized protein n=1 Tax=Penicillium macrosclerotiorum TaxID=303699 RepID=UPI0025477DCA|nr:uncharacterized protein N7462_003411 [Penicillium macrosclerotiorum]KAJ5689019.1 hypothetical protein N7462_003411 [Penicillium macrosclerotiorum]
MDLLAIAAFFLFQTTSSGNPLSAIAGHCSGYTFPDITCINRYGAVLPHGFYREVNNEIGNTDTYSSTNVGDLSFQSISEATFLVWDPDQAAVILGETPTFEYMFSIPHAPHEAPVYVPRTHELWFSQLEQGFLPQFVVDLKSEPPRLAQRTTNPPLYAPTGARYRNGSIIYSSGGLNHSIADRNSFVPGVYKVDPITGDSQPLVNNYFGWYFNTCDDVDVDADGNIWFTDNYYSWADHTSDIAPQLGTATYRFDSRSGNVAIVDDTLSEPNGIAFSPDGRYLYLSDTGAGVAVIDPQVQPVPGLQYNNTGKRTVYAFDVSEDGRSIGNKRPIYLALEYAPDGLKVARNGMLVTATGHGVDVLDARGKPLVRVQTNFTAVNMEFVGPNYDELWIIRVSGSPSAEELV